MYGTYPPNTAVALGDFGSFVDGLFRVEGNIADHGLSFEKLDGGSAVMHREWKSDGVRRAVFSAGAVHEGLARVKAGIKLEFGSDFGVYFNAAGCCQDRIRDIAKLGGDLVAAIGADAFFLTRFVVTAIMRAQAISLIINMQANSSMMLEAKTDAPDIDLSDIDLSLKIVADDTSSEQWINEKAKPSQGLTPFFWLHGVKTHIFSSPSLEGADQTSVDCPLLVAGGEAHPLSLEGWKFRMQGG